MNKELRFVTLIMMDDIPRNFWYRLLETVPGTVTWLILLGPIILSFWFPRAVAIFITIYVLLWFLRALKSSIFLIHSYFKSKRLEQLNWEHILSFFSDSPPHAHTKFEKQIMERTSALWQRGQFKKSADVYHVVIMPTYKEEKEILESSIEALAKVDFPLERIIFVLATEERDRMRAETNAAYLQRRFSGIFGQFHHIMHPSNLPNELPAKGANISYACKKIAALLKDRGIPHDDVLVTTLDADNRPSPTYFSNLTYHYLMQFDRGRKSYQPLSFFYNNIWDVPFANRLIALANTFWYLSESGESYHLFNASAYAQSLDTLVAIDFWSRHTIVEDLHQYWRTYFYFRGDHEMVPLFVPVYQDALQNKTYFTSLVGQYKQLRRWAWGASETPYVILKTIKERRSIPIFKTLHRFGYMAYLHVMWSTAPIIILLNKLIPTVLNPQFAHSIFAYNLGQIFNVIFTVMLVGIISSLWISTLSVPRPKGRFASLQFASLVIQWLLIPFVTIMYGAIPAIDAQTRLMLGNKLGFEVTEKIRKIT